MAYSATGLQYGWKLELEIVYGPLDECIDSVHYIGTFVGIPAAKALTRIENREVLMPSNYRKSKQFNWSDIVSNAFMPLRSS